MCVMTALVSTGNAASGWPESAGRFSWRPGDHVAMRIVRGIPQLGGQRVRLLRRKQMFVALGLLMPFGFRHPRLLREITFP